jgi:uncharacterized protein YxeA
MQKSLVLFIILIIVITIAAITERSIKPEKTTPLIAQTSETNKSVVKQN